MTPAQVEMVRDSWAIVRAKNDLLAQRFYQRLFQLDPSLRLLFGHDMSEQRQKLMRTVGILVRGLHRADRLRPALCLLGRRHAGYGVQPTDYAMVRHALLEAISDLSGGSLSPEMREAWSAAYDQISTVMLDAAEESEVTHGF
jgi:hemoglobin-like flavoprotein